MDINQLCPHCLHKIKNKEHKQFCDFCGKPLDQFSEVTHQLKPMTILAGKYIIGDVLGEGGFGITYVGFDLNLELRVAVKEFYPNGYASRESKTTSVLSIYSGTNEKAVHKWRDNFIQEARNLAKCENLPGIVGVKDFFQENNTAYIILEFVEGKTLKEYTRESGGKLPADQLIARLRPVIEALGEVHRTGIIHRDISPDNIMLMPGGKMKLIDFGAAREFATEDEKSLSVMLKAGYAPEEQYRSKGNQGPWSDVYALAGTIYRCITGVTPPEAVERVRNDELIAPSKLGVKITPQAETALLKALSVYAEGRYKTMEEFAEALYAGDSGSINHSDQTPSTPSRQPKEQQDQKNVKTEEEDLDQQKRDTLHNFAKVGAVAAGILVIVLILKAFFVVEKTPDDDPSGGMVESASVENDTADGQQTIDNDQTGAESSVDLPVTAEAAPEESQVESATVALADSVPMPENNMLINPNTIEDYPASTDTSTWLHYDSGMGLFRFSYPQTLYNREEVTNNLGIVDIGSFQLQSLQNVEFWGEAGSYARFEMLQRTEAGGIDPVLGEMWARDNQTRFFGNGKGNYYYDAGFGYSYLSGYDYNGNVIYEAMRMDDTYVYRFFSSTPPFLNTTDRAQKEYVTTCLERLTGFTRSDVLPTYEEFVVKNAQRFQ